MSSKATRDALDRTEDEGAHKAGNERSGAGSRIHDPRSGAKTVGIAGTFNDWNTNTIWMNKGKEVAG